MIDNRPARALPNGGRVGADLRPQHKDAKHTSTNKHRLHRLTTYVGVWAHSTSLVGEWKPIPVAYSAYLLPQIDGHDGSTFLGRWRYT